MEFNRELALEQAKKYDSFYLYDEKYIREHVSELKEAFPDVYFLYSMKCNPNTHVLKSVIEQGLGVDAASSAEVQAAREAGLSKNQIYYSAPGKTLADIENSMDFSVLIADSLGEIKRIQNAAEKRGTVLDIGMRINPDFTFLGGKGAPAKFGIDEEQALEFLAGNDCPNVRITGIHTHLKSQELDETVIAKYYGNLLDLADRLQKSKMVSLEYINLGSGIGITFAESDKPVDIKKLGAMAGEAMAKFRREYPNVKLLIETGRYAVGKSGVYVTKVLDRKVSRGKTYIILKNTFNGFVRPAWSVLVEGYSNEEFPPMKEPLYTCKGAFDFIPLKDGEKCETVNLVGNLCTAIDAIAEDVNMPHLEEGDVIAITNAGAYAAVITPMQFSSQERPKEVFVKTTGEICVS